LKAVAVLLAEEALVDVVRERWNFFTADAKLVACRRTIQRPLPRAGFYMRTTSGTEPRGSPAPTRASISAASITCFATSNVHPRSAYGAR
jgi:hypothetical protein